MVDLGSQTPVRSFLSNILLDIKQERMFPNAPFPGPLCAVKL